jgi:hypothetical protein
LEKTIGLIFFLMDQFSIVVLDLVPYQIFKESRIRAVSAGEAASLKKSLYVTESVVSIKISRP